MKIQSIGKIIKDNKTIVLKLEDKYKSGLKNIEGYSHLQILLWAHLTDHPRHRNRLIADKLFKNGPDKIGVFATRSPARPNPIMISTVRVNRINFEKGEIQIPFIDAVEDSPILDIKPYYPMERVRKCNTPDWCGHWPQWQEDTGKFNWADEINFKIV